MAKPTSTTPAVVNTMTPTDRLILSLAELVADKQAAQGIKHLFLNQRGTDIQLSLDMHQPN